MKHGTPSRANRGPKNRGRSRVGTETVSLMLLTGRQKACSASWIHYLARVWT